MSTKLSGDLKASVVVSLVALPLCLGIALASGAPLSSGILAGIIGGIVTGFISNSQISVSGPAAGLTVIVFSLIEKFGLNEFYAIVALAGLLQIFFAILRGGRIGDLFPSSVIHGMLAAIGLTLIIKQLPTALGTTFTDFHLSLEHLFISGLTLVTIVLWDRHNFKFKYLSSIPSALMAVVLSIIVNSLFSLFSHKDLVSIPANFFSTLSIHFPTTFNFDILLGAMTIAIVASIETLLCIDAADKLDPEKRITNKNRELLAQGVGNTLSGLVGALPLTAVIVRTTTNISAGAKTKWSTILHGVWLLIFVGVGAAFLNKVPLATLSVVLLIVGYKLTKPALFKKIYNKGPDQLIMFISTIIAILMTDLLKGIFIGLLIALVLEAKYFKNKVNVRREGSKLILSLKEKTSYLSKLKIEKTFDNLKENEELIIECTNRINSDVKDYINNQVKKNPNRFKVILS